MTINWNETNMTQQNYEQNKQFQQALLAGPKRSTYKQNLFKPPSELLTRLCLRRSAVTDKRKHTHRE